MTRSTIGDSGDGTAHGITPDIGDIHGIRTMPDGTADSILIGTIRTMVMAVRASDMEDISQARHGMVHDMRHRVTAAYSPTVEGLQSDVASDPAAAQVAERLEEVLPHAAA